MDDARIQGLTRAIAGFGLPGVPEPEPAALDGETWPRLLSRIRAERITGLAVESAAAGWLRVTDEQAAVLLDAHRDAMTWCLKVERKLFALADAFDTEGIGFAVLKGTSVAHTMYADPSLRSFADVDLLVSTADYERACALLGRLGHRRQRPEPRRGFEVRFGKASVHTNPDDRIEVDLHRTLVLGPFGLWIDPDELLERREPFLLAGRKLHKLDDTGMLLNVAMHAALGWWPPKLVPLRDVQEVSRAGAIEWPTLERWATSWRLKAVLDAAFNLSSSTLGAERPAGSESLARSIPDAERRALRRYEGTDRAAGGTAVATIRAIPGVRSKAAYIGALTFPDRRFLEARADGHTSASYRRRLLVPVRWAMSRLGRKLSIDRQPMSDDKADA